MRVLSVAFPGMPVGTGLAGGAEQILSILDDALVEAGHESVVVASKGSRVAGDLVQAENHGLAIRNALRDRPIDLIHFHGLDFYQYVPKPGIPMLATLHLPVSFYPPGVFTEMQAGNVALNCVSRSQADSLPCGLKVPVIPNGIPVARYQPGVAGDYLLWLGRICPEKGTHIALEVARQLNAPLIVAGPVHEYPEHQEYFARTVEPLLDRARIYAGPVDFEQKRTLLAQARCLLIPSLVAETSSLVAMEALSSGTPVIALRAGALPEIVDHGKTGYVVDSPNQMASAIDRVDGISRDLCREKALSRFDSKRMVRDYLELYGRIITRHLGMACAPQENL